MKKIIILLTLVALFLTGCATSGSFGGAMYNSMMRDAALLGRDIGSGAY